MTKLKYALPALLIAFALWYGAWRALMAPQVAQVKASIAHHDAAIRAINRSASLRADGVSPAGFPFGFRVRVARPTLAEIWSKVSYAVSFESVELERVNTKEGRYRLILPDTVEAIYAEDGKAPERYVVKASTVPAVLLRATESSSRCPNIPGVKPCPPAADGAPLISFAVSLPSQLTLDASMSGQTKQIGFTFIAMEIPVFHAIPSNLSRPLQLFVGMLREALVFKR
jgi:hypothetical protein